MSERFQVRMDRGVAAVQLGIRLQWRQPDIVVVADVATDCVEGARALRPGDRLLVVNGHSTVNGILSAVVYDTASLFCEVARGFDEDDVPPPPLTPPVPFPPPVVAGHLGHHQAAMLLKERSQDAVVSDVFVYATATYTGVYFRVHVDAANLSCHMTIGHWHPEPRRSLTEVELRRLEERARQYLSAREALRFSGSDPIDLGRRSIITLDVRESLHAQWWGLHGTITQWLRISRESRRVNFHLSVDGVF